MAGVGPVLPPQHIQRAPTARLGGAIAASLLIHGWLLFALPIDSPWPVDSYHPAGAPIMVRIAPTPALMSDNPRALDLEKPRGLSAAAPSERSAEEGIWGQTRLSTSGSASQKIESDPTFLAFDSRYYLAQELDSYPRPLAPLHFSRPAGGSAVEVLLEVLVDERGVVQDVILAQSSQSGRADEELRALLAAAHFLPARRDGRAVKSRLVLRVRVDREDGER